MGGEYRYDEFPQLGNEFPRGQFFFNGQFTNTVTGSAQTGGYHKALNFLMGNQNVQHHHRRRTRFGRFHQ